MILTIGGKKYVEKGKRERAGRFKLSLAGAAEMTDADQDLF